MTTKRFTFFFLRSSLMKKLLLSLVSPLLNEIYNSDPRPTHLLYTRRIPPLQLYNKVFIKRNEFSFSPSNLTCNVYAQGSSMKTTGIAIFLFCLVIVSAKPWTASSFYKVYLDNSLSSPEGI